MTTIIIILKMFSFFSSVDIYTPELESFKLQID